LVLLPGHYVGVALQRAGGNLLHRAVVLERGADDEGAPALREDQREEPLREPPADAGEIRQRGAAGEHERVEPLRREEVAGLVEPRPALLDGDRPGPILLRGERLDRGRESAAAGLRFGRGNR